MFALSLSLIYTILSYLKDRLVEAIAERPQAVHRDESDTSTQPNRFLSPVKDNSGNEFRNGM